MNICIWRYLDNERNYPGYHLSADQKGCSYLQERLNDEWAASTISLNKPTQDVLGVPNNQDGRARIQAFDKLRMESDGSQATAKFSIQENGTTLILTLPAIQQDRFLKGVDDIANGEGDYSIHGEGDVELWFWWQVE